MAAVNRREFQLSRGWIQASLLVFVIGFTILGLMAYRTYEGQPPIPGRVVDADGETVFTAADVMEGQRLFYHSGLMQYGSIFGHGAYLGPDFTADYLHRAALLVREHHEEAGRVDAERRTIEEFKTNRYDLEADALTFTAAQAAAFEALIEHYGEFFGEPTTPVSACVPGAITDAQQIRA